MFGTAGLQAGRLDLESILRAPLVVIADPFVAASGPPATLDEVGGGGAVLLERPAAHAMEEIVVAFEAINADYERHSRAARAIAEQYFRAETVLAKVLDDLGL